MRNAFPVFLLAALLAAPAPAEPPAQKGSTKLQVKPGPPQIGGSNVPPVDPDKNKLVPAVQKAGMTGMEGMDAEYIAIQSARRVHNWSIADFIPAPRSRIGATITAPKYARP